MAVSTNNIVFKRTLVAAWDLQDPDLDKPSKRSRQRATERLGMGGDRRNKVARQHILPGGKYRAICKLFMGFSGSKGFEYMGTGWLITQDIVVTAAHCLYDSDGGYLRYIKVYIGYEGPEDSALRRNACEKRLGKIATIPAEYIKTGHTIHDVGFIKLEEPFNNVEPFQPEETPKFSKAMNLGVVGYPGDIEGGNEMYEHWDQTDIDLAKNGLLNYWIDTEAGESGSPILREIRGTQRFAPIGVHTDGGSPNSGSVIGPLGNSFADYTAAIKIKQTKTLPPGAERMPVPRLVGARNLEYITIPASKGSVTPIESYGEDPAGKRHGKESSAMPGSMFGSVWRSNEHKEAGRIISDLESPTKGRPAQHEKAKEAARRVRDLESGLSGSRKKEFGPEAHVFIRELVNYMKMHRGLPLPYRADGVQHWDPLHLPGRQERAGSRRTAEMYTGRPQTLPATAYKESGPPTGETQEDLIKQVDERMQTEQGPQTKFFLNFPPKLTGEAKKELRKTMRYVQEWQCWAYGLAALKTQQQVRQGKLTAEASQLGAVKRSTYENMVYDHIMRSSPWLAKTKDEVQVRRFKESKANFHTSLIQAVISGFTLPGEFMKTLHEALDSISSGILEVSKKSRSVELQYFIMLTKYDYESLSETIQASIRVISFKTNASVNSFTFGKSSYADVDMEFTYHQYQCNFNTELYGSTQEEMNRKVVEAGRKFSGLSVDDIDLQVESTSSSHESVGRVYDPRHKQCALVQDTETTYDSIVGNLAQLTNVQKGLDNDDADILNTESVDAGVAALIGMRLAMQGQQQLKEVIPHQKEEVITQFPQYWQLIGSLVFKQLFPDTSIPRALRFHTAEKDLQGELEKQIDKTQSMERHNESLLHALDAAKAKADAQEKEIMEEREIVKALRKLVSSDKIDDELKSAELQIEKLKAEVEKVEHDKNDAEGRERKLKDQLEKNEHPYAFRLKNLLSIPGLTNWARRGVVDLVTDSDTERPDAFESKEIRFGDDPFLEDMVFMKPNVLTGISGLKSASKSLDFSTMPTDVELEEFTLFHKRDCLLRKFTVNWLAISDFNADIMIRRCDLDCSDIAEGALVIEKDIQMLIPHKSGIYTYIDTLRTASSSLAEEIQFRLSVSENYRVVTDWSLNCFTRIGYVYLAIGQGMNNRRVKAGYIEHGSQLGPLHNWTVEFDKEFPFTEPPAVFIALNSFGKCKPELLHFSARLGSVDMQRMEVTTSKDCNVGGPDFVKFLWIAVEPSAPDGGP
ncbi:hypothetical protein ASPZODRAFT_28233 [Penicilliopsis zonata CBS 506.65]|uniref:Serine protease n=1 Tax=Penicilliopsis zonata CBS 506.65 TaxID=1073090 RepID=A0A1L9S8T7_9EURO|nr:hypothetical protein ASPZODRAFT_28233 [Penicilliopsis zonata CBS 506.65]OJJ43573.1 hypothetical protein ASPZODRAFT_28233 [Penicilliopsis zonata CBS 506.65]